MNKVWCKAHRIYCEHARPDSKCTSEQCVLVRERKPQKWEIIERNRVRFCLNHCPFPKACKDCFGAVRQQAIRGYVFHKAVEAGFTEKEARDMSGWRG